MSRTKGKSKQAGDGNHHAQHHEQAEPVEHPVAKDHQAIRQPRPARTALPKGATNRRRMSYGYRTAPRQGG